MDVTLDDLEAVDSGAQDTGAARAVTLDDLEAVDAPDTSVYHEPSNRVLGLPQTLDPKETQYTIDKEIDGKKDFFAMQPRTPEEALGQMYEAVGRRLGAFVGGVPGDTAGVLLEQVDLAKESRASGKTVEAMKEGVFGAPRLFRDLIFGSPAVEESLRSIKARNERWLKDSGLTAVAGNPAARLVSDVTGGLAQAGAAVFMRIPRATVLAQSAFMKSDSYDEAKAKDLSTADASAYSDQQFAWNLASEAVGTSFLFKSLAEDTVAKAFRNSVLSESGQEGVQNVGQDLISNEWAVTDKSTRDIFVDAAYSSLIGGLSGGTIGGIGAQFRIEAENRGANAELAALIQKNWEQELVTTPELISRFLNDEVRPIADSDHDAKTFLQIMDSMGNDPKKFDESQFSQAELQVYDQFLKMFNESAKNPQGVAAVEQQVYNKFTDRGLDHDQAVGAAKLMGARANAAAMATGETPMQWYRGINLDLEVQRTPEAAVQSYQEKLDALKAELPDTAAEAAPMEEPATPEDAAAKAQEIAGFEKRLNDAKATTTDVSIKKPIIAYLKSLGGIRTDGLIYGELKHLGIDRKRAVGLFNNKDTALRDIDNIPVEEFNRAVGSPAKDDGNGYVDRDWLLEKLRDEQFGERLGQERPPTDESFLEALDKVGLDYRTATAEQVYEALGADGDILIAAAEMGVVLSPKEVRQVRGIMESNPTMYVQDAIDDFVERSAIMGDTRFQRDGEQAVLPGAEKATDKQLAEKGMEGRLKPKKAQKPMDEGMFGDGFKQQTLFQAYQRTQTLQRMYEYDLLAKLETLAGYKGAAQNAKREAFLERARANTLTEADLALKKDVVEAAKRVGGKLYQAAYHGSPYNFDRFTLSHIGKGLGQQAYGWGLYFSSNKKVAEYYRDNVAKQGDGGKVYKADIPDDSVLLVWDKKIKDQPESVRAALDKMPSDDVMAAWKNNGAWDNVSGAALHSHLLKLSARNSLEVGKMRYELGVAPDEAVSRYLNSLGIRGVKYIDMGSRTAKAFGNSENYVIFDDSAINILDTLNQEGVRGSITFGRDRTLIQLFKNANPSTLLHELGHFFLRDMDRIAKTTRRPMVKKDYEAVKKWLGSKDGKFTEAQEEKFARGFEAYLREGKAPTEGLKPIFARFKDWLTSIYKSAKDLNVTINDDVRAVFDRMLGADYAKSEQQIKERDAAKLEKDYKIVEEQDDNMFWEDAGAVLASGKQLAANMFTPVSSRLGRIDPTLKAALRRYTFELGLAENRDRTRILPFLKSMDKMTEADYKRLDFAMKNRDEVVVNELAAKYGITAEIAEVRSLLDDIYNEALSVGLDVGYLEDYFPRMVRLEKSSEFMAALRGRPDWSLIEEALKAEDPMNTFTTEEQAVFVNKWLRGYAPNATVIALPSFVKDRVIDYVEPQFNKFYLESPEALLRYISAMRLGIAQKKIFGKGANAEESIGAYVLNLVKTGVINADQENEVRMIFNAALNSTGPGVFVSWMKNFGYIYLMGSPISAITQIGDLAFALAKNGYYNTGVSLAKAVAGKSMLKKEDLGIANIAQEFEDGSRVGDAVRLTFRAVGIEYMDNIGKQVYIESAYKRLRTEAKKNGKSFKRNLEAIFGDQAASVRADLMDGTMSDNVKLLLFSELSDVQPVSLAEMPVGYLRGGNWRALYMLKTYTVKQIDTYRREIFDKIATGEADQVREGMAMMIRLAVALMLTGMGADALKDLVLGRAITLSELVMDNLLKLGGITKFQIYQSRQDGVGNTVMQMFFVPPLYAPFDNIIKDIQRVNSGKIEPEDAKSLSYVPLAGKFYYWWVGGGRKKEEEKAGTSGKTKETW